MKQKILFLLAFTTFLSGFSQVTTGLITGDSSLSFKFDITATEVTATVNGPADRWFAVGIGGFGMLDATNNDLIYSIGGAIVDGTFSGGRSAPIPDATQSWTEVSNTVSGLTRTVVSTRALDTGEANDYVFSITDTEIDLLWAHHGSPSFSFAYHGGGNRSVLPNQTLSTLGIENFTISDRLSIYPNPTNKGYFEIKSTEINVNSVSIFDLQGRKIKLVSVNGNIQSNIKIDLSNISSGIYNIIIDAEEGKGLKKLLIN